MSLRAAHSAACAAAWQSVRGACVARGVADVAPAAHRHPAPDAGQRLHPADARRLDVRADADRPAARVGQLPAQPRLRADVPARRQRHRLDAHHPRHAARPDPAPAAGRAGLRRQPGGARHRHVEPVVGALRHRPAPARRAAVDAGLDERSRGRPVDGARQLRAGGTRSPRRADAVGRDTLSARPVPRLDGLAAARPAAGLSAASRSTRRALPAARPARRRPDPGAAQRRRRGRGRSRLPARRSAEADRLEEGGAGARDRRRPGQPRHQHVGAPGALARLDRVRADRRRGAPVAPGGVDARRRPRRCRLRPPPPRRSRSSPATATRNERAAWKRSRCGIELLASSPRRHERLGRRRGPARRAELARLAAPAARGARHAVPARRDRLDGAAARLAPAGVGDRDDGDRPASGAAASRSPTRALPGRWVLVARARRRHRPDLLVVPDAARQGARRHPRGRADGAEDARAARAPRRVRRLLPRLLHHPDPLPLLAVAAGGGGDAGLGVGPAHRPRPRPHAGRAAEPAAGRRPRRAHRAARRAGDGAAVPALPAHRPALGRAAGRHLEDRPVEHDEDGLDGRGRARRLDRDAAALRRPCAGRRPRCTSAARC